MLRYHWCRQNQNFASPPDCNPSMQLHSRNLSSAALQKNSKKSIVVPIVLHVINYAKLACKSLHRRESISEVVTVQPPSQLLLFTMVRRSNIMTL